MQETGLNPIDERVRGLLTQSIAAAGVAPTNEVLAARASISLAELEASLGRLADAKSLLLHPGTARPWVVHPFALAPGGCWVETSERGHWANCLYCGFGILAALRADGVVTTRLGGEAETVSFEVTAGKVSSNDGVFHLSTPVARWWDNVMFACASFQPFRSEAEIDPWCARHAMPRGAVLSIDRLWAFASDWYGGYVAEPWHKRSATEIRALFARHGLEGPFWSID